MKKSCRHHHSNPKHERLNINDKLAVSLDMAKLSDHSAGLFLITAIQ